jgi:hypothetical protein
MYDRIIATSKNPIESSICTGGFGRSVIHSYKNSDRELMTRVRKSEKSVVNRGAVYAATS